MIDESEPFETNYGEVLKQPSDSLALIPLYLQDDKTSEKLELTEKQKKIWVEMAVDYMKNHSIPFNRKNLALSDREILSKVGSVFRNAIERTKILPDELNKNEKILKPTLERGIMERQQTINLVLGQISNWQKKYYLDAKAKDYISPLAIEFGEFQNVLDRNQYLESDLSPEEKISKKIIEREKYLNEIISELLPILQKNEHFKPAKKLDLESKAILLRTVLLNYVKFGKVSSFIDIGNITAETQQNSSDDFLMDLWRDKFTQIPMEKWQKIESFLKDLYGQTISRVNSVSLYIKKKVEEKNIDELAKINSRLLRNYLYANIPTEIIDARLKEVAEELSMSNIWEKGKTLEIEGYIVPKKSSLISAKNEIISTTRNFKHPDLEKINQAIKNWEEYYNNQVKREEEITRLKREIKFLQIKINSKSYKNEDIRIDSSFKDKMVEKLKAIDPQSVEYFLKKFDDLSTFRKEKGRTTRKIKGYQDMQQFISLKEKGKIPTKPILEKLLTTKINYLQATREHYENQLNYYGRGIEKNDEQINKLEREIEKYSRISNQLEENKLTKDKKMKLWNKLYTEEHYLKDEAKIKGIKKFKNIPEDDLTKLSEKEHFANLHRIYEIITKDRIIVGINKKNMPIYGHILSREIGNIEEIAKALENKLDEEKKKKYQILIDFLNSPPFAPILYPMSIEDYYHLKKWILDFVKKEKKLPVVKQQISDLSIQLHQEKLQLDLKILEKTLIYWQNMEFRNIFIGKMRKLNLALEKQI